MTRDRNYSRRLLTIFSACILAALALVVSSAHVGVSPAPTRTLTSSVYDHLVQHSGAKSAVAAVRHRDVSLDRSGNEQVDPAPNSALAVAAETVADAGGFSNSALEASANAIDLNGLTRAGRALQKHGDRPDSVFPRSVGSAEPRNAQGLDQVNAIINDPNRAVTVLDKVINIYGSNGAGVRYSVGGDFMGFLEP